MAKISILSHIIDAGEKDGNIIAIENDVFFHTRREI